MSTLISLALFVAVVYFFVSAVVAWSTDGSDSKKLFNATSVDICHSKSKGYFVRTKTLWLFTFYWTRGGYWKWSEDFEKIGYFDDVESARAYIGKSDFKVVERIKGTSILNRVGTYLSGL